MTLPFTQALAIAGPTACGKTELVLRLAESCPSEAVSCDSRKVFRGADIGSAKPTAQERARARFHMLDLVEPQEGYSAQQYVVAAQPAIADILRRGMLPLIEGGTGLYLEALMRGYDFRRTPPLPKLRQLALAAWESGAENLRQKMTRLFPGQCLMTDMLNRPRVMRLLERMFVAELELQEALRALGELGFSEAEAEVFAARSLSVKAKAPVGTPIHGVRLHTERDALWQRIELRTRQMINYGLVAEVEALMSAGVPPGAQVMTGIGYREVVMHLRGELAFEDLAPLISLRTRQFAKRQDTWNRNRFAEFEQIAYTSMDERDAAFKRLAEWIERGGV